MKKLTSLGVAAFAALVAVLAFVGSQTPAQAYPDVQVSLEVDRTVLYGGQDFTATAQADVSCDWSLEWNGDARVAQRDPNVEFRTTYTAPGVTKVTKIPLTGTCVYDADQGSQPADRRATTWQRSIMITVLPPSSAVSPPVGSDLPNTGGPNLLVLAGGIALLLSGAAAVTIARRRAEEAEIQASRA
jgi:LPXTG-motif cell wall-anchored protein